MFGDNLKDLLLAAPAGPRAVLGLDPGLRTGVKVAVVDHTGKLVATETIYPHQPKNQWDAALYTLGTLCVKHGVELIAIGNGTASRETDKLAGELIKKLPERKIQKIVVSEAGASVLLGVRAGGERVPDAGREPAWRRVHRAPTAGSAGGAREDRAEGHRRRSVPARRQSASHGEGAGREGRGLRERRGRARELRIRRAAVAGVGTYVVGRREHHQVPRRARCLQDAQGVARSAHDSGRRFTSSARASCVLRMATSRWTRRPCIPRRIRSWSAS